MFVDLISSMIQPVIIASSLLTVVVTVLLGSPDKNRAGSFKFGPVFFEELVSSVYCVRLKMFFCALTWIV